MSETNVLVLSGNTDLNLKVLYCLYPVLKNIHVIANARANKLKYSRYKKNYRMVPWSTHKADQRANISAIKEYCRQHEIDILVPGDIDASSFLYKYRDDFNEFSFTPIMANEQLVEIDNKWKFAESLMKADISTPKTMYIEHERSLNEHFEKEIAENVGFPLIVKPLFGESGHGVKKITDVAELRQHVLGDEPYSQPPLIVQTYIDGYDIDASFIADKGEIKSIAVQRWVSPNVLEYKTDDQVEAVSAEIVRHYNYSGPGHIDMRREHNSGKIYAIEFNPRFWYTMALAMWQGLNFVEASVNYTLGREYDRKGAHGKIRLPLSLFRKVIKKPWSYYSYSESERKALWQSLSDPVPFILNRFD